MKKNLVIFILLFSCTIINAQEEKYIGLFVYNFTRYFDWPIESKSGDFIIEVLGHKSVYDELVKVTTGKVIGSQKIIVRHLANAEDIGKCHIFFLGHWQTKNIETVKTKIGNNSTLVVSEFEGLLQKGSIINFIIRNGSMQFELNEQNASKAGLSIDPALKQMAYSGTN